MGSEVGELDYLEKMIISALLAPIFNLNVLITFSDKLTNFYFKSSVEVLHKNNIPAYQTSLLDREAGVGTLTHPRWRLSWG